MSGLGRSLYEAIGGQRAITAAAHIAAGERLANPRMSHERWRDIVEQFALWMCLQVPGQSIEARNVVAERVTDAALKGARQWLQ